jgi:hypothetical protein
MMTTSEFITVIISILALIISGLTAYLTLLARFRGIVLPKRWAILAQIDRLPCLILDCEFVNEGAKPGSIEDIVVRVTHSDTGAQTLFVPSLVKEQYSIFGTYQGADFLTFSGISLGAKQRKELFIVFRPNQSNFEPSKGIILLQTSQCNNIDKRKYRRSPIKFSLELETDDANEWANPIGKPRQKSAVEIVQSRRAFIKDNQV